jgi:crotonobetainyl-CoA:carnitine CoA-transferase CaiB-like acyl-CoA transferase
MIAAGSDALFRRLADVLGDPELGADPRFADNPARVRNRHALVAAITARTRQLETGDLLERLRVACVPAAPILTVDRVLEEPQTAASGMIVAAPHPRLPDYRTVGLPIRWDRRRPGVRHVPPLVGEHSVDVLTWLGYTVDDVRNLQAQGVVA